MTFRALGKHSSQRANTGLSLDRVEKDVPGCSHGSPNVGLQVCLKFVHVLAPVAPIL